MSSSAGLRAAHAEGIADSVLDLIGETPMVRLSRIAPADGAEIVGKLESLNPGGSVKDRIALSMIEAAEEQGLLTPGDTIVEPTSGNTGVGLALVSAVKGYRLILTMPDNMSVERRILLKAYGAEVILTPATNSNASPWINSGTLLCTPKSCMRVPPARSPPKSVETERTPSGWP